MVDFSTQEPEKLQGHEALQYDIDALHADIDEMKFHDFKSQDATPKMNLRLRLLALLENVQTGRYDDISNPNHERHDA